MCSLQGIEFDIGKITFVKHCIDTCHAAPIRQRKKEEEVKEQVRKSQEEEQCKEEEAKDQSERKEESYTVNFSLIA